MRISPRNFRDAVVVNDSHGYRDIEFIDRSRNAKRRLWRLSIPYPTEYPEETPYASLRRSLTDESELDIDVRLPEAFVTILTATAGDLAAI